MRQIFRPNSYSNWKFEVKPVLKGTKTIGKQRSDYGANSCKNQTWPRSSPCVLRVPRSSLELALAGDGSGIVPAVNAQNQLMQMETSPFNQGRAPGEPFVGSQECGRTQRCLSRQIAQKRGCSSSLSAGALVGPPRGAHSPVRWQVQAEPARAASSTNWRVFSFIQRLSNAHFIPLRRSLGVSDEILEARFPTARMLNR